MTKNDIIHQLVKRTDLTTSQATHAVENLIDIIADALVSGDTILMRGFGTIKTVRRAAKQARNISKGTAMMLPPTKQVKFIAYNALKERINRKNYGHPDILP